MSGERKHSNILLYFIDKLPELYKSNIPLNILVNDKSTSQRIGFIKNIRFNKVIYCTVCDEIQFAADFTFENKDRQESKLYDNCINCAESIHIPLNNLYILMNCISMIKPDKNSLDFVAGIINNWGFRLSTNVTEEEHDKTIEIYNSIDEVFCESWNKMNLEQKKFLILSAASKQEKILRYNPKEPVINKFNKAAEVYFQFPSTTRN